jgi:hypothetical protein
MYNLVVKTVYRRLGAEWALYEGLNRSGELQKYKKRKRESSGSAHSSQENSRDRKTAKRS